MVPENCYAIFSGKTVGRWRLGRKEGRNEGRRPTATSDNSFAAGRERAQERKRKEEGEIIMWRPLGLAGWEEVGS